MHIAIISAKTFSTPSFNILTNLKRALTYNYRNFHDLRRQITADNCGDAQERQQTVFKAPTASPYPLTCTQLTEVDRLGSGVWINGGGMAEWLASPDWDREVLGSNPGVARSDGQ